jgi:hypothetical protein
MNVTVSSGSAFRKKQSLKFKAENKERIVLIEQRKAKRLQEFHEITTTVISRENNLPIEKIHYNYSDNISVAGAKIRGNIPFPVDTLLKIDFSVKDLHQKITTFGKVKWIKSFIDDEWYEEGVEFVPTPGKAIQNYIFMLLGCNRK